MKFNRTGITLNGDMEGPIGESCTLFGYKLDGVTEIALDMTKVTQINSVGVKNWISWTMRIPTNCKVSINNCPYVIANQANMVLGFMTPNFRIESFRAPFVCDECGHEETHILFRGNHYEYAQDGLSRKTNMPTDMICGKCKKGKLEPDFLVEKTFKFLG